MYIHTYTSRSSLNIPELYIHLWTKTLLLLLLEAQSEHLRTCPQKQAAKRSWKSSWKSTRLRRHVSSVDMFRYDPVYSCVIISEPLKHFKTKSGHTITCISCKIMGVSNQAWEYQPLPGTKACPTSNPRGNYGEKDSTNGMSQPLTLQNDSSHPESSWASPFPNQDTGATSAPGAVFTSSGCSSEAGSPR